jgi:hypothetical protein
MTHTMTHMVGTTEFAYDVATHAIIVPFELSIPFFFGLVFVFVINIICMVLLYCITLLIINGYMRGLCVVGCDSAIV